MDKFLIAPVNSGLKLDIAPFLAPEDSFTNLRNVVIDDGAIIKRPGTLLLDETDVKGLNSRLRVNIGTTDGAGNLGATVVPGAALTGQQFSVGTTLFTAWQAIGAMYVAPAGATGTINTGTSTVTITGAAAATIVYWYPSTIVKHFDVYSSATVNNLEIAFDLEFAYKYQTTGWERITGASSKWATRNTDLYNSENFRGALSGSSVLLVTNDRNNPKYYNDTTNVFTNFTPSTIFDAVPANYSVRYCALIKDFGGRLLLLNTTENEGATVGATSNVEHKNRIRYSEYGAIFNTDSWYQSPGSTNKGDFIDLQAGEDIKACEILNGRLIIFTLTAIYELIRTNNQTSPFTVSLIDSTFGSTPSNVLEINNTLLFANNFGLFIYNGKNITKLSSELAFSIGNYEYRYASLHKSSSLEYVYISLSKETNNPVSNIVILYNYENNTFSFIDDIYTAFGDMHHGSTGAINSRKIMLVGNQKGYTFFNGQLVYKNAQIQNITYIVRFDVNNLDLTAFGHRLVTDDYIRIEGSALAALNGSYKVIRIDDNTLRILNTTANAATYLGDGIFLRIDQIDVRTKEYNPYMKQGFGTSILQLAFNVNRTTVNGRYFIGALPSGSTEVDELYASTVGQQYLETIGYDAFDLTKPRVWFHTYLQFTGESVGIALSYSDPDILNDTRPFQELTINAILLYTEAAKYI